MYQLTIYPQFYCIYSINIFLNILKYNLSIHIHLLEYTELSYLQCKIHLKHCETFHFLAHKYAKTLVCACVFTLAHKIYHMACVVMPFTPKLILNTSTKISHTVTLHVLLMTMYSHPASSKIAMRVNLMEFSPGNNSLSPLSEVSILQLCFEHLLLPPGICCISSSLDFTCG